MLKLEPHLVPKPLWKHSASEKLGRTSWQAIRQDRLREAGDRCEICREPSVRPLNCHEIWSYDDSNAVATLVGFEMHCAKCDLVTHMGRAIAHGYGDQALQQMTGVNGINLAEAKQIWLSAKGIWKTRNAREWSVKIPKTLVERYPRLRLLERD